jgi:hypothetical protein
MPTRPTSIATCALVLLGLAAVLPVAAQTAEPNDYEDPATWLCRPDRADACAVDLSTTWIGADGGLGIQGWQADPYAPIDCFYVYPTVSQDPGGNSDMEAGPEEAGVIAAQFARFGSVCRTFAPLYRQFTLAALRSRMGGGDMELDQELGYGDVVDAWYHYLENDNEGRGVVLIGHSQGASTLLRLISEHIDGRPAQDNVVSAILLGTNVQVPNGGGVGGSFRHIPLCRTATQTGCVITYSTYRATVPPSRMALFGRGQGDYEAGCTNPAALEGGRVALASYLGAASLPAAGTWLEDGPEIPTDFVSLPGLLYAECVERDGFNYLEITVDADPDDPRADDIGGDIMTANGPNAAWGLHLIDVHVAMGDLVEVVRLQGKAFLEK